MDEIERLVSGEHHNPHELLGHHGSTVRTYRPGASQVFLLQSPGEAQAPGKAPLSREAAAGGKAAVGGKAVAGKNAAESKLEMRKIHDAGLFAVEVGEATGDYRIEAVYPGGAAVTFDDPYRFWPTLGDVDQYLFGEGRHHRLWEVMGSHHRRHQGALGTAFAVWAPNARSVRVVGDFNLWDGRLAPMRSLGSSGAWELFIPGVMPGARYKYEVLTSSREIILKADPFAFQAEVPPATSSVVTSPEPYPWSDGAFIEARRSSDQWHSAMSVYEVHLGSWRRVPEESDRPLSYLELAEQLPAYVADMGFTHVELMPLAEHPFGGSWGYQVSSYYAPTSRYGSPDDLKVLVEAFHIRGIRVIMDWVPAHFPRDAWALARFDGTALYEHEDPRLGEHPDWGTLVFNFGRNEVRNFLVANALYWIEEFHLDGLRVDAVASMLYLDYSRKAGEWVPNRYGGRENLEAVAFLRELNEIVHSDHPGVSMIAEESTAWPGVSRPTYGGGLGFGFKWNMGWMHDTLEYFSREGVYRRYHQSELTFGLLYAFTENFILPLSHDEVVHGKGSLVAKMPGDDWQKRANLRALLGWMWAHPGKEMLFMGAEIGQWREWSHDRSLDWHLLEDPAHAGISMLVRAMNRINTTLPALWAEDFSPDGFSWIDASDVDGNIASFLRMAPPSPSPLPATDPAGGAVAGPASSTPAAAWGPGSMVACIGNFSPVPRFGYRVGLPVAGRWREVMNTDAPAYGGSGIGNAGVVDTDGKPWHGRPGSALLTLPPLGVLWLVPEAPGMSL
ncbi:MAG: 1,4-alpha-glucan branching protein GlgB [Acidimicrobiales bacterium]